MVFMVCEPMSSPHLLNHGVTWPFTLLESPIAGILSCSLHFSALAPVGSTVKVRELVISLVVKQEMEKGQIGHRTGPPTLSNW